MASTLTWFKSSRLFLLALCSDQISRREIWKTVCITSWTKQTKSVCNICSNGLLPRKKAIKQFIPWMKAVEEKQGRCIKMLFGECFYIRIALYMRFLVFVKKFIQYCRSLKRQFHSTILPGIFFSDVNFHFFCTDIFSKLLKIPLYFCNL